MDGPRQMWCQCVIRRERKHTPLPQFLCRRRKSLYGEAHLFGRNTRFKLYAKLNHKVYADIDITWQKNGHNPAYHPFQPFRRHTISKAPILPENTTRHFLTCPTTKWSRQFICLEIRLQHLPTTRPRIMAFFGYFLTPKKTFSDFTQSHHPKRWSEFWLP